MANVILKDNLFYTFLLVTFLLSIGSCEGIDNRMLVMEKRDIPPNIKGS